MEKEITYIYSHKQDYHCGREYHRAEEKNGGKFFRLDPDAKPREVVENDKSYTPVDKEYQSGQDIENYFYGQYGHKTYITLMISFK
ncbi:MAG: hypothetical protein HYX23_01640 [Candidatus Zambryskibacteria bacterium]|nr:hypothetical protein [Candidatus Zambryskibacteria bacterium]